MKNILLKLNMAIVFIVVLFAGVVFADANDDDAKSKAADIVISELQKYMFNGYADLLIDSALSSDTPANRVILKLDSEALKQLNDKKIKVYFGKDEKSTYIATYYTDDEGNTIRTNKNSSKWRY